MMLLSCHSESQKNSGKVVCWTVYIYKSCDNTVIEKKINRPRIEKEMKILKLNSYLTGITAYQKNDFFIHYKQACRFKRIRFSLYRNVLNVHGI